MRLFECRGQNVLPWHLRVLLLVVGHTGFSIIENTTLLVQPVHLATYIERHFPRVHSILAKIDTEGFEIQVLESMRPLWDWPTLLCWSFNLMLGDLLM